MTQHVDVVVARIGKPHGIRGEVTVELRTDEPEKRLVRGARLAAAAPRGSGFDREVLTVAKVRWHQSRLLVAFEEVPDRNAAEAARGVVLTASVPADERPEDPEEFYDHQLLGLSVHDTGGTRHGEIVGLLHGAQDVLQVRTLDGREALVPFVAALVPEIDLGAGRVVVDDRPGLLTPLPDEDDA